MLLAIGLSLYNLMTRFAYRHKVNEAGTIAQFNKVSLNCNQLLDR